ncbi:hypothetical protein NQD34_016197 [Periophthalmus magnuspinnatus]|nr:hypothetical protein NQD34_016197 [Periophthalmus magnuspinnatus]
MQLDKPFWCYLHLLVYFPLHRVSWFSAALIFRRSALFFHLCHVFSLILLLSIFAVRRDRRRRVTEAAAVYSGQTAGVSQRFSGPCDVGDAAEGSRCPAKSAIFCPSPPPRSVRQW